MSHRIIVAALVAATLGAVITAAPSSAQDAKTKGKGKTKTRAKAKSASSPRTAADPVKPTVRKGIDLRRAYEKEYAFLASEELALKTRLVEVGAARKAERARAEGAATRLEKTLRTLKQQLKRERAQLVKLEEDVSKAGETGNTLEAVLSQAEAIRERHGRSALTHPAQASLREKLTRTLSDVTVLLKEESRIRVGDGTYYLADGSEATGQLVSVGGIATLAAGEAGAGVLAPAGGGRLQLWNATSAAAAKATAAGEQPPTLPLYLYESREKPAEKKTTRSAHETVEKGGFIGWVIVGLGALTALLILLRSALLLYAGGNPDRLFGKVEPLLREGRLDEAKALCPKHTAPGQVLGQIVPHLHSGSDVVESAATEGMLQAGLRLDRFETAILVAAAVAPLLGLLGTVTGMIATFDVITVHGTGDPKLLSGGISEALITTQLGLTVAIPALLVGNLLSGWGERIRAGTERIALRAAIVAEATSTAPTDTTFDKDRADAALGEAPEPAAQDEPTVIDGGGVS